MIQHLQLVAASQGKWSATANKLKLSYERARWFTFLLSILGALLASIASQVKGEGNCRLYLAIAAAILFAIVSLIATRRLGKEHAIDWTRARAASEALKRAAYKYAARAAPYDDSTTCNAVLDDEREKIEKDVENILDKQVKGTLGSTPVELMTPAEYIEKRVTKQSKGYFEPNALRHKRLADRLRHVEVSLAVLTAIITALLGAAGKNVAGLNFDFVALTAVLTTISGSILSHIEASRYDYTILSYRVTASRLDNAVQRAPKEPKVPSPEWSAFVERCENILADENNSWVAKFSKPS